MVINGHQQLLIYWHNFVLNNIHKELTAVDIWNHLDVSQPSFQRREWGKNHHVLAAVEKCNNSYIHTIKNSIVINNISRDETQTALNIINDDSNKNSVLLTGKSRYW